MSKQKNIWGWLALVLITSVAGSLMIGIISSHRASMDYFSNIAQLVGKICIGNPELESTVMKALKNTTPGSGVSDNIAPDSVAAGSAILTRYGYTSKTFYENGFFRSTGSCLLSALALFSLLAAFMLWFKSQNLKRITGLTAYLYAINIGEENVLHQSSEDDFALLEDEIYKTVVALRQSEETAVRERKSLSDNLADISHQLKTPITSISLMSQLLADSLKGSEDVLYVEKIQKQLERFSHLISALLTLSRLDAGTLELEMQPLDMATMLTGAVEPVERLIKQRGQTLEIQSEPQISYAGDLTWSMEAVLNLVKNCSEHTPYGGTIAISYEQNPVFTKIVVEDSGTGFLIEDIPYLFKRFYKGKNAGKDSVGIGLALSKAVIEKQNGDIQAENRPEGGARFIIKFYQH